MRVIVRASCSHVVQEIRSGTGYRPIDDLLGVKGDGSGVILTPMLSLNISSLSGLS